MCRALVFGALLVLTAITPTLTSGQNAVGERDPAGVPTLVERTLLDGKITVLVPEGFTVMTEEVMKTKYPSEQRPTVVLTNPNGTVNVALNHTQNHLLPSQIGEVHEAMQGMFENLYPSATWHRSELTTIGGREFFVLDLLTPAIDTEIRNVMGGTSLEERLMLITFNCTKDLEPDWAETGRQIIESVKFTSAP